MSNETKHTETYSKYGIVAIVLLAFSALNILMAGSSLSWAPALIIFIACIQAYIALSWFMHLRYDNVFLRVLVFGVFMLFAVVVVITFLDYKFR
jgi:cytochrome c oxidase subunit IV